MAHKRVLIIEDEDANREVARINLELVGDWEVSTCGSRSEGLVIAKEQQPDAILLDVMMPDMDGSATFKELQREEATKNIPVILLTGKERPSEHHNFNGLGVRGVFAKPFGPLTLASDASKVLGWPP